MGNGREPIEERTEAFRSAAVRLLHGKGMASAVDTGHAEDWITLDSDC
ncbi:hypothetical protein [Streptomyces sp. NPDC001876]